MKCTWCKKRIWWWQTPNFQLWEMSSYVDESIHYLCQAAKIKRLQAEISRRDVETRGGLPLETHDDLVNAHAD